jgi:hypothetical protein
MNLKVLVCVKQTFDTEAKIELKDGKISDAGINLIINPYDEVAVEGAIQLKEKGIAKEVVVLSAGADKAMDAIRTALAMGADRGILVKQDTAADEYQRAVALAAAIKDENPDLILAGHVAADDGSSQVPTRIAEILGCTGNYSPGPAGNASPNRLRFANRRKPFSPTGNQPLIRCLLLDTPSPIVDIYCLQLETFSIILKTNG